MHTFVTTASEKKGKGERRWRRKEAEGERKGASASKETLSPKRSGIAPPLVRRPVNSRRRSLRLRTLFAHRFAPTDFSIVSGRRNARPSWTPNGMLIHAVQILFLRDLNSSNEKTITRPLRRCLQSDSIDSSPFLSLSHFTSSTFPPLCILCTLPPVVTTHPHRPPFAATHATKLNRLAFRSGVRAVKGSLESFEFSMG